MDTMQRDAGDLHADNIRRLAQLFPQCVTETADEQGRIRHSVDFEALRQLLSAEGQEGTERYAFTWPGKRQALALAYQTTDMTLRPCFEDSDDWEHTGNLYLEGDNLEVLKLLQKSYQGRVKMIYIDPPYNTGNDFIYRDDFRDDRADYELQAGERDANGQRLVINGTADGRFHSRWCSMIYPRLIVARQLLRDDGVIFISIDDHEVANLRKICDEVFGEQNFAAVFPWRKRTAKSDRQFGISQEYEWIMAYARSGSFRAGRPAAQRRYYETDDFPGRPWRIHDLTTQRTAAERPNSCFDLINPRTGQAYPANPQRVWCISRDTFDEYYQHHRIIFPGDYAFLNISRPVMRYWQEDDLRRGQQGLTTVSTSLIHSDSEDLQSAAELSTILPKTAGMSKDGTQEMQAMFGSKAFPYPKPTRTDQTSDCHDQ